MGAGMTNAWGISWGTSWGDSWGTGAAAPVASIPPGGSSKRKRKKLSLKHRLSDEKIRALTDRVHVKRRTIWERPQPQPEPLAAQAVTPTVIEPQPYFAGVEGEAERIGAFVDIASARAEMAVIRQEVARAREIRNRALREERIARVMEYRALRRKRDEEEALVTLLMAA